MLQLLIVLCLNFTKTGESAETLSGWVLVFVVNWTNIYVVGIGSSSLCRRIPSATSQWVLYSRQCGRMW